MKKTILDDGFQSYLTEGAVLTGDAGIPMLMNLHNAQVPIDIVPFEKARKEKEDEDEESRKKSKFLGLIPAIGSVILFILTEDLRNKMTWTDKYTLAMVVIMLVNFVIAYLTRNKKKDDDEETPTNPDQTVTA